MEKKTTTSCIPEPPFTGDSIFPKGAKNEAYARYFTGTSHLNMLSNQGIVIANVTFEPGCRNFWHIHHTGGQILLVTGGRGWYQESGKSARELRPGDVVNIPPETRHWHGAASDSWFSHLAVEIPSDGGSTEWLEPVSEKEYSRLQVASNTAECSHAGGQSMMAWENKEQIMNRRDALIFSTIFWQE